MKSYFPITLTSFVLLASRKTIGFYMLISFYLTAWLNSFISDLYSYFFFLTYRIG